MGEGSLGPLGSGGCCFRCFRSPFTLPVLMGKSEKVPHLEWQAGGLWGSPGALKKLIISEAEAECSLPSLAEPQFLPLR